MNPRPPRRPSWRGTNLAAGSAWALAGALLAAACGPGGETSARGEGGGAAPPSILLVTLDTTRADAMGLETGGADTPAFNGLAARGLRFRQAYATAPETLPSHCSMMTGLYPAAHGVHENARPLPGNHPVVAERLQGAGYRTAAFVSSFVLARRFGLARGFDLYDDEMPRGGVERTSLDTTERALAFLSGQTERPLFVWVHYFDPHAPYTPPEPFKSRYAESPYLGEVAAMDGQLGRLLDAFTRAAGEGTAVLVVGDHGEGLGDHGESQHGNLLYQSTMRVPLVAAGPGVTPGVIDRPVSGRRVFQTILGWASLGGYESLLDPDAEIVLGEAMRPFLSFGWQPQVMAVDGPMKAILAGRVELYDVASDPGEERDLAASAGVPAPLLERLRAYPVPERGAAVTEKVSAEDRERLAALGYLATESVPPAREDAPRPVDMVHLFDLIDEASTLFVREEYARAIPLLEKIRKADPQNLDATLRLATAHSSLGHERRAQEAFDQAKKLAPDSVDVRTYLALHYARGPEWRRAVPLLEDVLAEDPDRLPALEALAVARQRQGRLDDALDLRQRIYERRRPSGEELVQMGLMAMARQRTSLAIESLERARGLQGDAFEHDLELGVLYLAERRLPEAREALDRVPSSHPAYPMALFKRAQVSVLLAEPDRAERIALAREHADDTTRPLIASERLFQGF